MHGTDDEDSNYEDDPEDDIEVKLNDLMGESNMSNMPNPCRRPGDMVMIVPCIEHEVDLRAKHWLLCHGPNHHCQDDRD